MQDERTKNLEGRSQSKRLADFIFELGMLRKTPRSGYQFLGTGQETVAEHSFRTAAIGWILASTTGADVAKTTFMCLFHDLAEARTGDFNYVNKMYNQTKPEQALQNSLSGTGLSAELLPLFQEFEEATSLEAKLAQDADQLDFIANLKEQLDLGNSYAAQWLTAAQERLRTEAGKELCKSLLNTDHKAWWFKGPDKEWWSCKKTVNSIEDES